MMRTVQMTLDENLVSAVDRVVRQLRMTRSAFARQALREALHKIHGKDMELKQRRGYQKKPVQKGEFNVWEREQMWGGL